MRISTPLVAAGAALALVASACGSTGESGDSGGGNASFNEGMTKVVNPSNATGGTLRFANADDWDSVDPADMYYGYAWNFSRLYGRTLTTFKPVPGSAGLQIVPDLAQSLGQHSADFKTWTYKIKPGVKFEDGTPVRSADIKYNVERSIDKATFPSGPTYYNDYLDLKGYDGPYKDKSKKGTDAIETPDDQTIIFHLKKPFSTFDYLAMLPITMPVPAAKDTGVNYKLHVVSTGPYKFQNYTPGKSMTLVKNTNWNASADPLRKQLPDRIEVQIKVDADDLDNRLTNGGLDMDVAATGLQAAGSARVQSTPNLKKNADAAPIARLNYVAVSSNVKPFDNIHCRRAIQYAVDKQAMQTAFGGPLTGGDIATHLLMPLIPGNQNINPYPAGVHGDINKAKQELAACGKPTGFSTSITARTGRPKEINAALAAQQSLAKVGIKADIKKYPDADYFKVYAGKPDFVAKNGLGLIMMSWGADWPEGFGYLSQIVDSRVIRGSGNTNLGVKDPAVDKLLDQSTTTGDANARNAIYAQIDAKVMDDSYIVPFLDVKGLLYRPPNVRNAYINQGLNGQYDYAQLGVK